MSKGYRTKFIEQLRKEFSYACGYCETREPEAGGAKLFHIDHYRPGAKFPKLKNTYSNLIYACCECNGYKRDYWHGLIGYLSGRFVLNPRSDKVTSHINKSFSAWIGLTECGSWNIGFLHLSDKSKIERREARKEIYKMIEIFIKRQEESKKFIERHGLLAEDIAKCEKEIEELEGFIKVLRGKIEGPMD